MPVEKELPEHWFCSMNENPRFRDCNVPQEKEYAGEVTVAIRDE